MGANWISVADALPNLGQYVIVWGRHPRSGDELARVQIAIFRSTEYWEPLRQGASGLYVTHWMPLPDPPKK